MNLILLDERELNGSSEVTLADSRADHMLRVLRAVPGSHVRVGVVDGARGIATVQSVAAGAVTLRCVLETTVPERPRVDLLLALPRPKVLRRLWAQLAAVGVGRIILTNAERVERNYFDAHVVTPECYGPLLIEGLQQARDTRRPHVSIHKRLRILVEDELAGLVPRAVRWLADPDGASPAAALDRDRAGTDERVLLAVGPEGGWNAFEAALFETHGFHRVGLGPRTLRSDTACIALLAVVHDAIRQRRR